MTDRLLRVMNGLPTDPRSWRAYWIEDGKEPAPATEPRIACHWAVRDARAIQREHAARGVRVEVQVVTVTGTEAFVPWEVVRDERSDVLAQHSGESGRREWCIGSAWLYPGDAVVVLRAAAAPKAGGSDE